MKKIKKQNHTKIAMFAGAAVLMALTPQIYAQSSMDDLLNKLEQKGVLTVDEADQLKADNATNSVADLDAAMNSRFPMPDWVTGYKLSGDFRGRFDDISSDNAAFVNRIRLRYRLRVGLVVDMKDNLEVGFRIGSGDSGNPLSNNQTLSGNASKKPLYVDTAYGKWTPIHNDDWMVAATFGKMVQPFEVSPMVFDPDYTPEGGALQATYKFNDSQSLSFNGAGFVLDELSGSSRDPFLYGGQVILNSKWTPQISTALGVSAFDIVNKESLLTTYDSNKGNTLVGGTTFASDFNPIVGSGSVTYMLDSFPLYKGKFPIKLAGEFMDNPAAANNNEGYWAGVTFGKSGKKGNWDISYRYQYLEANAWWDQIVNDDNVAFFPTSPTAGSAAGGTNIKGHLVAFNYSIFDSLTFSFTCYVNDLINNPVPGAETGAVHAMADLMWKF
jgi:Putative porin